MRFVYTPAYLLTFFISERILLRARVHSAILSQKNQTLGLLYLRVGWAFFPCRTGHSTDAAAQSAAMDRPETYWHAMYTLAHSENCRLQWAIQDGQPACSVGRTMDAFGRAMVAAQDVMMREMGRQPDETSETLKREPGRRLRRTGERGTGSPRRRTAFKGRRTDSGRRWRERGEAQIPRGPRLGPSERSWTPSGSERPTCRSAS